MKQIMDKSLGEAFEALGEAFRRLATSLRKLGYIDMAYKDSEGNECYLEHEKPFSEN